MIILPHQRGICRAGREILGESAYGDVIRLFPDQRAIARPSIFVRLFEKRLVTHDADADNATRRFIRVRARLKMTQ